jgi:ATP adenylyltransferase
MTGSAPEPAQVVPASEFAGVPDGFERLWTPHRMAYLRGENKPDDSSQGACPFCRIPTLSDPDGLVVARAGDAYAVLNLYPYNPGHIMVIPYRHVADYTDLTPGEVSDVAALTQQAMIAARAASAPHGFNIGINQGGVAGAGISAHLHQHVVPRWGGDSNFLPIIARTKAVPVLLGQTRVLLARAWPVTDGVRVDPSDPDGLVDGTPLGAGA